MQPIILLDSDSLYFRTCWKTKKTNEIRLNIRRGLEDIREHCFSDDIKIALKGYGNWRKDYYPEYKSNRKPLEPEMKKALTYAHKHLVNDYGAIPADGMEADDLVSIWAHEAREDEKQYVIAGIDKDLLQIPGNHYNFVKQEHQFIDDDEANRKLMIQCMTGDNSDNIPGIKGIGPVKADKFMGSTPIDRRWGRVKALWRARHAGDPYVSWRLLKMLTTFEELNDIQKEIEHKTSVTEPSVATKGIQKV